MKVVSVKQSVFIQDLLQQTDDDYKKFTYKLIPNIAPDLILGIRTPTLRMLAKRLYKEQPEQVAVFLEDLPHVYYDENNLHGLLISEQKDFDLAICSLDRFLPYVDNWATCDIISPKVFKKHRAELLPHILRWINSDEEYTIRFGIEMLMTHFLDDDFEPLYLEWVAAVEHEAYYVKMMVAWFFATALTKQYDHALPVIEGNHLALWTHNKTIQKARESRRISTEQKEYLNSLKRK